MCGIAGYIGKTKFKPTEQQLKTASHRFKEEDLIVKE